MSMPAAQSPTAGFANSKAFALWQHGSSRGLGAELRSLAAQSLEVSEPSQRHSCLGIEEAQLKLHELWQFVGRYRPNA